MSSSKITEKLPSELLGMETALLISTAPARNIDVSLWFNEKSSKLPQREFDSRIMSLSATMGIGQDAETKKELELAISPLALRMVHSLCSEGEDEFHQPLIDIPYFFKLCEERVNRYLEEIEAAEAGAVTVSQASDNSDFRSWKAGEYDIEGNLIRVEEQDFYSREDKHDESVEEFEESKEISPEEKLQILYNSKKAPKDAKSHQSNTVEIDDDLLHVSAEEYLRDIQEKAALPRPKSAPSGGRGSQRGESTNQVLKFSQDYQDIHPASRKPSSPSPYDEEYPVQLQSNEEDEIDTVDYVKHRENKTQRFDVKVTNVPIPKKQSTVIVPGLPVPKDKQKASALAKDWHEANRAYLMASGDTKPFSKDNVKRQRPETGKKVVSTSVPATKMRSLSAGPRFSSDGSPTLSSERNRPKQNGSTARRSQTPSSSNRKPNRSAQPIRGIDTTKNDSSKKTDADEEELWRQQLREDPLSFIFPKSSLHEQMDASDPKRRNSFNGFLRGSLKPRSQPIFHSVSHLKPSELTEEEINHAKDTVEDTIRQLVKKTDLYHRLQISLGYIEDYTYIPPRGQIIQSMAKDWVSDRELHTAFLSARLFLNDQQIWMIKRLVHDFAKIYRQSYTEKVKKLIRLKEESGKGRRGEGEEGDEERLPKTTQGPGHQLSNVWLKKYLLHLRLTKRDHSNQSHAPVEQGEGEPSASGGLDEEMKEIIEKTLPFQAKEPRSEAAEVKPDKSDVVNHDDLHHHHPSAPEQANTSKATPVPWKEWLAKKLQAEMMKGPMKPKEFSRILNGNVNTTLSKEEIELYLKNHPILPEEALSQEIEYRIEAWILDLDGRRDFQHQLNMKIRSFIWEELILKPAKATASKAGGGSSSLPIPIPKDEKHYWKLFYRLPAEEKEQIKSSIITSLINEKREMWRSSERLSREMTKTLFWQYFHSKKDASHGAATPAVGGGWNQWLLKHLESFQQNLEKYKRETLSQRKRFLYQQQRKRSLASLLSVEKALKSIMSYLDHYHQLELQKKIIHLRRLAKEKGLGKGEVVTKEDFDEQVKTLLLPYLSGLNDSMIASEEEGEEKRSGGAGGGGKLQVEDADNLHHQPSQNMIAKVWKEQISQLFTTDSEQTLQQVLRDHQQDQDKNKISFQQWINEKKQQFSSKKKEEESKKAAEEREKEIKQKNSAKAYKKWLRMRRKNQYKSMVDNKYHALPAQRTIDHQSPWIVHDHGGDKGGGNVSNSLKASGEAVTTSSSASPRSSIQQKQAMKRLTNSADPSKQRSTSVEKKRFVVTNLNSKSKGFSSSLH